MSNTLRYRPGMRPAGDPIDDAMISYDPGLEYNYEIEEAYLHQDPDSGLQSTRLVQDLETLSQSTPLTTKLRWISLAILFVGIAAGAITFGLLMSRDIARQDRLEAELADVRDLYDYLDALVGNLTEAPNCTLNSNVTIGSSFSDALFGIYKDTEKGTFFAYNLTSVDPMSTVVWTLQPTSGTIAYLSNIPAINSTFLDSEFVVYNAAVTTKKAKISAASISAMTTIIMTVQDASGIVAYLSDITSQPTIFFDDVFAVQHYLDTTAEVMLDVSQVTPGDTTFMTVQNKSGIILYLENITSVSLPPFSDADFLLYHFGDPTAEMSLNLSLLTGTANVTMTVQDKDGIIAYLSDIPQVVEVFISTTRTFPDLTHEGVTNISQLGTIRWMEFSVCGGGGGGGSGANGGGGGSGSGHQNLRVYTTSKKFYQIECAIGAGGAAGSGGSSGGDGNYSTLTGVSGDYYYLYLAGYGGGGGEPTTGGGAAGGSGGGGGGNAAGTTPGDAGDNGGLIGGQGGLVTGANTLTDGTRGEINLSWRAGGGGSAATGSPVTGSEAAAWNGGYATNRTVCDGSTGCGAASMFGSGGIGSGNPDGARCAGGGSGGAGGDGACLIRYLLAV